MILPQKGKNQYCIEPPPGHMDDSCKTRKQPTNVKTGTRPTVRTGKHPPTRKKMSKRGKTLVTDNKLCRGREDRPSKKRGIKHHCGPTQKLILAFVGWGQCGEPKKASWEKTKNRTVHLGVSCREKNAWFAIPIRN